MTDKTNLYRALRSHLNNQQLPNVVRSILREPLIRRALQEEVVFAKLLATGDIELQNWQPGNLALLQLDEGVTAAEIREKPTEALSPELRQKAVQFYELYRNQPDRNLASLAEAGLIALALRERARILTSWEGLAQELPRRNRGDTRLILSCAYGYLPEPEAYLREYCQGSKQLSLCAAVIFLQPISPQQQARLIASIAQTVRTSNRLQLLLDLQCNQPSDARLLAHELLRVEQPGKELAEPSEGYIWSIPEQFYFSELYRLAGQSSRAVAGYKQLGTDLSDLQAETIYRLLAEAIESKDHELIERYQPNNSADLKLPDDKLASLAYRLYESGQIERAEEFLPGAEDSPPALILKSRYQSSHLTREQQLSALLQAVHGLKNDRNIPIELIQECSRMLLDLQRPDQVMDLARYLIDCQPEEMTHHLLLAQAARMYGDSQTAVVSAQLAAALAPEKESARRELIAALEAGQDWEQALSEYLHLLKLQGKTWNHELSFTPLSDQEKHDFRKISLIAAQAGETEKALDVCWKLLENQADDGLTHLVLGRIYSLLGELELAGEHLLRANQLIPDHPEAWLHLADLQFETGNPPAAENTLKTAVQALPDEAGMHLALGRLYHRQGNTTQALNALQRAAHLDGVYFQESGHLDETISPSYLPPRTAEIVLLLGSTLLDLGHADQATGLLGNAYQTREHKQESAYPYARALLAVGQERQALSALSIAHQTEPDNPQLALEYARLLLKLGEQPETAATILQKLHADGSEQAEIIGLLAEALAATADFHSALVYYQKALESNLINDPHWSIRLALGLSHVAVETNTPNLAIAALQDAIQQAPDHLALHQKLAEACLAAGLEEDARHISQQAYQLSPASVDNILWYTKQCQRLKEDEQAYQALCEAVDLFPNNIELHLDLAQIEVKTGRLDSAAEHFQTAAAMPEISYQQLHTAANGLLWMKRPELCVTCLERVQPELLEQKSSEKSHQLLILLASAYDHLGENETALQLFDRALEHQPESSDLLKQKAIIHLRMKQYHAAAACLNQVARSCPNDPQTYQLLVQTYEAQGDLATALQYAHSALAYTSNEGFRPAVLVAARLSWSLFQEQDASQFIASFTSSSKTPGDFNTEILHRLISALIAVDSQNWAFISELNYDLPSTSEATVVDNAIAALEFVQHGETKAAREILHGLATDSENKYSEFPHIYALLIETALQLFEFDQALSLSRQWLKIDPHSPRAHLATLRSVTEWVESDLFLREIAASKKFNADRQGQEHELHLRLAAESQEKLISLLGVSPKQTHPPSLNPSLPEQVRRWTTRFQAVNSDLTDISLSDQNHLLQELGRLAPDPGNAAALAAAARRMQLLPQSVQATRDYSNHAKVLAQLVLSLLDSDPSGAMAAALNALDVASGNSDKIMMPAFHALIARAAASTQNFQQAYRAIAHALTDWPDEPGWQHLAAEYARQIDDLAACIQHLEKAVLLEPGSLLYRRTLAQTYQAAGALNRAAESYQLLCKDFPRDRECWLEFAELQFERNQMEAAADAAEKALELDTSQAATVLFTAQLQLHAQNYTRAEELARQEFEKTPEDPAAAYLLACSLSAMNRKQNALEVMDQALRYSDRPLDLYLERIRLVRALHGLQPAFQSLQALDRQHPDHPAVLALMAEYEQAQGRIQQALETAQRALLIGGQDFDAQEKSRLHALVGRILRRSGQLDQAVHEFVQAVNLNPNRIELYLELGKTYQDRKELDKALEVYQTAIQITPDDPRPYQQAGQALKECKDYLGAEKMIRRAAELSPHDISIHRLLGSLVALNLVHNS